MSDNTTDRDRAGIYQVSTNRGRASHKLRYVEASAPADGDCRMCVGSIADQPKRPTTDTTTTAQVDGESPPHEDR